MPAGKNSKAADDGLYKGKKGPARVMLPQADGSTVGVFVFWEGNGSRRAAI